MLWILLIILIVLWFLGILRINTPIMFTEGFDSGWHLQSVGKRSLDCYNEKPEDCMHYANCGICYRQGKSKCIPGDVQGPYYTENCDYWQHTDFYDRHIFGEKVETTTAPWSRAYSDWEQWAPSQTSRATLMY